MNRAAKIITSAAVGLSLLAFSPKAFTQNKPTPEPIKKETPKPAKKGNGTRTLCTGDTLHLNGLAPEGSKAKLKVLASKNAVAASKWVTSNGKPGYFSGRLTYKAGKKQQTIPVSVIFKSCESEYASSLPASKPADKAHMVSSVRHRHLRDFFKMSPLEDTRSYGGAILFMDGYGIPNIGVNMDYRVKRLNDNWAIRSSITISIGMKKFHSSGRVDGVTTADSTFRDASARNIETYASLGLEGGTGNLSAVAGPILGIVYANGKFNETAYFRSHGGKAISYTTAYSYDRWKSFIGLMCSFSANFDVVKLTFFADAKWAISVDGSNVPDPNSKRIFNYGVSIKFPLKSSGSSRQQGHISPGR